MIIPLLFSSDRDGAQFMNISDVHCLGYDWYACRFRKLDVFL